MDAVVLPLMHRAGAEPFARYRGRVITVDAFLQDVDRTAGCLPDGDWVINTCEDRYCFMVAFFAAVAAGKANLLPPSRTPDTLRRLAREYAGAVMLADDAVVARGASAPGAGPDDAARVPAVPAAAIAAVAFTSGSTGTPQPHRKPYGMLAAGARLHAERLALPEPAILVATVPPWHMYGLEWSMLVATRAPVTVYCGESFYPEDLRRALDEHDGGRVLVTTPMHLRALLRAGGRLPRVDLVVSATAPLEPSLARAAENALGANVLEIYGCSEVGTLAHRVPVRDPRWQLFAGFRLSSDRTTAIVTADFLPQPVPLADRIEIEDGDRFRLLGRVGDLVKVGGKRASLAELTARLLDVPGVRDAVIVDPSANGGHGGERLCAFVVAPGHSADDIRRELARVVDPVFLPRPLKLVDALPRSATGKLTREAVDALLESGAAER